MFFESIVFLPLWMWVQYCFGGNCYFFVGLLGWARCIFGEILASVHFS